MTDTGTLNQSELTLPINVVTKSDISRMVSDLERVDSEMATAAVHAGIDPSAVSETPSMSTQLTDFLQQNSVDLANSRTRSDLIDMLRKLKRDAPVMHMTFSVAADRESLERLVQWVRQTVHPQGVIQVGIQPSLVAGVYLRTPNRVHDLSLRALMAAQHQNLVKELESLRGSE